MHSMEAPSNDGLAAGALLGRLAHDPLGWLAGRWLTVGTRAEPSRAEPGGYFSRRRLIAGAETRLQRLERLSLMV